MKQLLILLSILIHAIVFSQNSFCDGWEDGYERGMKFINEDIYIVPICPIPPLDADIYKYGYSLGFNKATGEKMTIISTFDADEEDFCDGWKAGYSVAMYEEDETIFVVPICPIPDINQDTYDSGYMRGYQKAQKKNGSSKINFVLINDKEGEDFCDGWENGYERGKKLINDDIYIVPICPIPPANANSYEYGYSLGFKKATGRKITAIPTFDEDTDEDDFCDGWKTGYSVAMYEEDETIFIVPICPISKINQDTYNHGYIRGYRKAQKKNGRSKNDVIPINEEDDFCDGWERGYNAGLQIWADDNNRMVPLKIVPICPIAKINQDTYLDGFESGKQRAISDMQ